MITTSAASLKSALLLLLTVFSIAGIVMGDGQLNPTESFVWGPKLELKRDGTIRAARLELNNAADIALKIYGRTEIDGDMKIKGKLSVPDEMVAERLNIFLLDVDEINVGRFKLHTEGDNFIIRDMKATSDRRYALFPSKKRDL